MAVLRSAYFRVRASDADALELRLPELEKAAHRPAHEAVVESLLAKSESWIASRLRLTERPAVVLDLGVHPDADLLRGHDLHLYAVAFADRIKATTGVQFSTIQIAKHHGDLTRLIVGEATRCARPADAAAVTIRMRHSYAKPAFQQALAAVTQDIRAVAEATGAVRLHVSYLTGLPRTWSRLWEPTVAGIFGRPPRRETSVNSSQVVSLQLDHLSIGEDIGHGVQMTISTSPLNGG